VSLLTKLLGIAEIEVESYKEEGNRLIIDVEVDREEARSPR
jgi:hypothetical protein